MLPLKFYDPIINGVQHYTYHREPTKWEIKFGEGATHYLDIPIDKVLKSYNGKPIIKKWTVVNRLRYYR